MPFNGDLNNWNMDINKMSFEDKYQVFDNSPLENNPPNGIIYKQRRGMRYTHALFLLSWGSFLYHVLLLTTYDPVFQSYISCRHIIFLMRFAD